MAIFVVSLLICFSPATILPYALPLASVLIFSLRSRKSFSRTLTLVIIFIAWSLWGIFGGYLNGESFSYQNAFLSFITYSAFFILVIVPSKSISPKLYYKMGPILLLVLLAESLIGYVQIGHLYLQRGFLGISAGDVVEGTLNLAFSNATGFETKLFAMNISLSLLLLLPYLFYRVKPRLGTYIIIAFVGGIFLLATVTHLILSFTLAIFLSTLLVFLPKLSVRKIFTSGLIILLILFSLSQISPNNFRLIKKHAENMGNNPKVLLMGRLLNALDQYPQLALFGMGPGQGISRAALIATGDFLEGAENLPLLKPITTALYETEYVDLYKQYRRSNSVLRPYSSWIAFFSEAGILGSIVLLFFLLYFLLPRKRRRNQDSQMQLLIFVFRASLLYVFIAGAWEFYWEVPQSIFIGLLILKPLYALIKQYPSTYENQRYAISI